MAPVWFRMEPIRTPKAMSRPTSTMISPNPEVIVLTVFSTPRPAARPRYTEPITRAITGLTLKRTISTTAARTATAVLIKTAMSDIRGSDRWAFDLEGLEQGQERVMSDTALHPYYGIKPTMQDLLVYWWELCAC